MQANTLIVTDKLLSAGIGEEVININTLKRWIYSGKIIRKFRCYHNVRIITDTCPKHRRAFAMVWLGYFLKKKTSSIVYANNEEVTISLPLLLRRLYVIIRDYFKKPFFKRYLFKNIQTLHDHIQENISLPKDGIPIYIRSDFHFQLTSGGSVGHTAGVLNNIERECGTAPLFFTSTHIPTVDPTIKQHMIHPQDEFMDYNDFPSFAFSRTYLNQASQEIHNHRPQFIYERYSCGSTSGVALSQKYQIPLVLEYNGSEIWVGKHWGKPFKHEEIFLKIEELNLQSAHLIVVVSMPLKEQLIERGIKAEKILVNPNGVNPEKYSPDIDETKVREKLHLEGKTVLGFIGTFGKWHGAELLVECFGKLLQRNPNKNLHLLMIGNGITMPQVVENIKKYQIEDQVTLTGAIPQDKGPTHLAACDILVSPHVPNSDGSKFFGSPTKLFEYMAMGKGIVASGLEQIGEILDDEKTALVVKPGDHEELIHGMQRLIDDPKLCEYLGEEARKEVIKNYTWQEHTRKIMSRLKELCPPA